MTNPMLSGSIQLNELDAFVAQANALGMHSHAERNAFLASRSLAYEATPGLGPFSAGYAAAVEKRWRAVAARPHYSVLLEHDPNVKADQKQLANLYPFSSRDTRFIGEYWMGVYFALKLFDDAPDRSVLEYGVGWGNTTIALLQSGFKVVAVDIEQKWLRLLEMRAQRDGLGAELQTIHGIFGDLPAGDAQVGGVLFYECFHHGLAHDEALERIVPRLMPGGSIVFAGEPVLRDFPIPWGVRLDGHSLWAIRTFGWMELGFNEDYFIALLRRHNLSVQRHVCAEAGTPGVAYKATRRADGFSLAHSMLSSGESGFLAPEADPEIATRFTDGNACLQLPCGKTGKAMIAFRNWLPRALTLTVEVNGKACIQTEVAAFETCRHSVPLTPGAYTDTVRIKSSSFVPQELGINTDSRRLGIAVGAIVL